LYYVEEVLKEYFVQIMYRVFKKELYNFESL
jgi:hypothetical protein